MEFKFSKQISADLKINEPSVIATLRPVSYTHLDVYKRQSKSLAHSHLPIASFIIGLAVMITSLALIK